MRRQDPAIGGISPDTFDAQRPLIWQIQRRSKEQSAVWVGVMSCARGWWQPTGNHA